MTNRVAPFVAGLMGVAVVTVATTFAAPPHAGGAQGPNPIPPPMPLRPAGRLSAKQRRLLPVTPNPIKIIIRMVRVGMGQPYVAHEITLNARGAETEQWVRWDPKQGMRIERVRPDAGDVMIDNFSQQFEFAHVVNKNGRIDGNEPRHWNSRSSLLKRENAAIKDVLRRIASGELHAEWVGQENIAGRDADIVRVFPANTSARALDEVLGRSSKQRAT